MADLNWHAIHGAYNDYKGRMGSAPSPTPQPAGHPPAHAMMLQAMSQATQKPGEDHGSMVIRALSDHLKRVTPNVADIHKLPTQGGV